MTEVCHDVQVEPHLHALSGEAMHHRSAVLDDNARVDIRASGFWRCLYHRTFFDACILNSFAASNWSITLAATFHRHENEKCRVYEERIREVEHGSFIPLVFSFSGGMGKAATTTCKHLAHLLSEKWSSPYSVVKSDAAWGSSYFTLPSCIFFSSDFDCFKSLLDIHLFN